MFKKNQEQISCHLYALFKINFIGQIYVHQENLTPDLIE
ncbi:hypothetical protein VCRA2119O48_40007 [Vibrio crassostreae]|uniref:Uncharacterized protein n=1 Tax=Vibrio celticus TaxID=446372 RepID=A0A1C3JKM0_9VIBR|nr:hypothetical protein EDB37_10037 [Vibrio crassostreae]CAH6941411.1 conserved hypothetical protein [Vibrio chagasii]SBT15488.1 hypothetical protein VCE7224_04277 [Vibrio celticus]CAH6942028.1 conserved hypothetical protein [Vibrio chagasii]CAH7312286.1 conserved hypothetical protein [Vibrio chagasii]